MSQDALAACVGRFCLVLLPIITLSPFEVHQVPDWAWREFAPVDFLRNLILFLPLGLLMPRRPGWALLVGAAISAVIELAQVWLYRGPSWYEVVGNALGGCLGTILFARRFGQRLLRGAVARLNVVTVGLAYLALGTLVVLSLRTLRPADFRNWEDYALVLGNEAEVDRPWRGVLHELRIYDRSLDPRYESVPNDESRTFHEGGPILMLGGASPNFGVIDGPAGRVPFPLEPTPASGVRRVAGGFQFDRSRWILPAFVATHVRNMLMASSQLSVYVVVTPAESGHGGQGRIVGMGKNWTHRNFGLGQKGRDIHWRVRTPATGDNGDRPQIITKRGPLSPERTQVLATFDEHRSRLYLDGKIEGDLLLSATRLEGTMLAGQYRTLLAKDITLTVVILSLLGASFTTLLAGGRSLFGLIGLSLTLGSLHYLGAWNHFHAYTPLAVGVTLAALPSAWSLLRGHHLLRPDTSAAESRAGP